MIRASSWRLSSLAERSALGARDDVLWSFFLGLMSDDVVALLSDGIAALLSDDIVLLLWVAALDANFWDAIRGGYYFTAHDAEQPIIRTRMIFDQPVPSSNGSMISLLYSEGREWHLRALGGDRQA